MVVYLRYELSSMLRRGETSGLSWNLRQSPNSCHPMFLCMKTALFQNHSIVHEAVRTGLHYTDILPNQYFSIQRPKCVFNVRQPIQ